MSYSYNHTNAYCTKKMNSPKQSHLSVSEWKQSKSVEPSDFRSLNLAPAQNCIDYVSFCKKKIELNSGLLQVDELALNSCEPPGKKSHRIGWAFFPFPWWALLVFPFRWGPPNFGGKNRALKKRKKTMRTRCAGITWRMAAVNNWSMPYWNQRKEKKEIHREIIDFHLWTVASSLAPTWQFAGEFSEMHFFARNFLRSLPAHMQTKMPLSDCLVPRRNHVVDIRVAWKLIAFG